jgi:hypothetical protein
MPTISPAVADAFRLLRTDLFCHLDEAEYLAIRWDSWSDEDVNTARALIPDLVFLVRQLLREHDVRTDGACEICMTQWPCPVVTTIHLVVKNPEHRFVPLVNNANGEPSEPDRAA